MSGESPNRYPQEFVERVKAEYPDDAELHQLLEEDNEEAGFRIKPKRPPLGAYDREKLNRRLELYYEWLRLYVR